MLELPPDHTGDLLVARSGRVREIRLWRAGFPQLVDDVFQLSVGEVIGRLPVLAVFTAVFLVEQRGDERLDESGGDRRSLVSLLVHDELQDLLVVVGLSPDCILTAAATLQRGFEIEKGESGKHVRDREVDDVLLEVGHPESARVGPHVVLRHLVVLRKDEDDWLLSVVVQREHIVEERL